MLQDVERADHVKLGVERDAAAVHLVELHSGEPLRGEFEPGLVQLGPRKLQLRHCLAKAGQHEPGAASDLEQLPGAWKIPAQELGDEAVARAEPEAGRLQTRQELERPQLEAVVGPSLLWREQQEAVHDRRAAAVRALPRLQLKSPVAAEADPHGVPPVLLRMTSA